MPINFNGQALPSYVKIKDIQVGLLPPVSQTTIQVPGREGDYDFGNTIGARTIDVEYFIIASDPADLRTKARDFAKWLYTKDPCKLILLDEPDKYYWAKVTGDSDLTETLRTGEGKFQFYCSDPFVYKDEQPVNFNPASTDPVVVRNDGFFDAYPRFEFVFSQPSTEFAVFSTDEYLYFGQPDNVDGSPAERKRVQILHDDCSSVSPWTSASGVDGGVITGALESTGTYIRQQNFDYGSGSTWHGAAGVRTFGGQELQDFTVEADIGFLSGYPYQVGRLEIYLLDKNGVRVGKMAIRDTDRSKDNPTVEARAGTFAGGVTFCNTNVKTSFYKQFNGLIRIKRIGQQWEFYIARRDNKGKLVNALGAKYFDKNNQFQDKIAGIQIHFGAYGTNPAVSTNYVEDIRVYQENIAIAPDASPIIFETGDKLVIDCSSGSITLNGEPFFHALDPSSSFIRLEVGDNLLSVAPASILSSGTIYYSQRWL